MKKFDGVICLAFIHHTMHWKKCSNELFFDYLSKFSDNILLEFVKKRFNGKNLSENKDSILKFYNLEILKKLFLKNIKLSQKMSK